jgi:cell fate regulator YaaT (PSP1 superfamily)
MTNKQIVGIRFQKLGKIYHFNASRVRDLDVGDFAVVNTRNGRQMGQVIQVLDDPGRPPKGRYWKHVERKATPRDLVLRQTWQKKELEATITSRAKLSEIGVPDVKIVASEFSFDGSSLTLLYSCEDDKKPNLGQLKSFIQEEYPASSVNLRLIGPRDVAKILGGMGACGQETRCCSMFLTEFSPISIKMAKAQGISLNPAEITGMCGRLRCCLIYEYENYVEARKTLPRRNKKVGTPLGEGKVIDVFPLKQSVIVYIPDEGRHEFMKHELQPLAELRALQKKANEPCDRHENGGCDCGKAKSKKE